MSSHYGPNRLGCTCATKVITESCDLVIKSKTFKFYLSSDYTLKLRYMKSESLVIAY